MLKIYGIKNCDTMKKAFIWLDQKGIKYDFHNYKTEGIEAGTIRAWLKKLPLNQVINMKGNTWKSLSDEQKASIKDSEKAIELIIENTSIVKRPLIDSGSEFFLGFVPDAWEARL